MNSTFIDNTELFIKEMKRKVELALRAIGEHAEGYAKEQCPVDTGRLRNSITYVTQQHHSTPQPHPNAMPYDSIAYSFPPEGYVVIGTNVEYAAAQEYGDFHHKVGNKHFMRNAGRHQMEYRELTKEILQNR